MGHAIIHDSKSLKRQQQITTCQPKSDTIQFLKSYKTFLQQRGKCEYGLGI